MERMIMFFLVAMFMVTGAEPIQAQRMESREKTKQLRVAKQQMLRADLILKQLTSAPKTSKVSSDVNRQIKQVEARIDSLKSVRATLDDTTDEYLAVQAEIYQNGKLLEDLKKRDKTVTTVVTTTAPASEIASQRQLANKYALAYDSIVYDAVTNPDKYQGLKRREMEDLLRYNVIRRQNLVYEISKEELTQAAIFDTMADLQHGRFMGIVKNDYVVPITFWFQALDGGRDESVTVNPKSASEHSTGWTTQWLVQGRYLVHFSKGSDELCPPVIMNVTGRKTSIEVYEPKDTNATYWVFASVRKEPYWQANMPRF